MTLFTLLIACRDAAAADTEVKNLQEDVRFLQTKLPQVHVGFDRIIARTEWDKRCERVGHALNVLGPSAGVLKVAELVSSLGVAHTWIETGNPEFKFLPILCFAVSDGLYVFATSEEQKDLAGARVISVADKSASVVIERLGGIEPSENPHWRRVNATQWSRIADAYLATGLSDTDQRVSFRFRLANGKVVDRILASSTMPPPLRAAIPQDRRPGFLRNQDEPYRIVEHPDITTLVLDYRSCRIDPEYPISKLVDDFWRKFDDGKYERVVVDLRRNGGGNSGVLAPFLKSLKERSGLIQERRLYAFISGQTFSSGMMNAVELRSIGAILVGEPTGGSPNSYGEQKSFELPNSKLKVTYCTKYFRLVSDRRASTVVPDWKVPMRWRDLNEGIDACMQEVMRRANQPHRSCVCGLCGR